MSSRSVVPSEKVLSSCVAAAGSAPSLHNSQPWKFVIDGNAIELYADSDRRLRVIDPAGREQLISVGAALFTLRLAISRSGFASRTRMFPSAMDPELVARVTVRGRATVTAAAESLSAAISHRRTNRWAFSPVSPPEAAVESLRDAARQEGAVLSVASPVARTALLGLARSADRWLRERPGYEEELDRWTTGAGQREGVPRWAAGASDALGVMPLRDFTGKSGHRRPAENFESQPTVLVLATEGDRPENWVRAGQALQRLLLTATCQQLAAMPISQLVEVPAVRKILLGPDSELSAQMVLRVGYGRVPPATPRRPAGEVLKVREEALVR
ncbi:Acg family FMN-binding oxidoreductase [Paractinoplanes brasiliensis]|uniref:Nitroreductase family protein n=1 Tax=Paractinoplanes brasiliensis TaxID=52695 RepID=A0A4R6JPX7_9ACTN|nr:nitroreductase family protein [Actinoplanes brasiliensis]TDO36665.1 nitroreductase family protein [Actinoplanes brasiliensis]GID32303.1 nitroreductase [Actinoplanes brasiliensis]